MAISINTTHATKVHADTLKYDLADICISQGITPKRAIMNMVQAELANKEKIYLSGSSFTSANANPFAFAMQKFMKVFFGSNENMIIGSAYHKAIERAYEYKIATDGKIIRSGLAIREIVSYVNEDYSKLKDKSKENYSKKDLIKEAIKYFKLYYRLQLPNNNAVEVETFMEMATPIEMVQVPENAEKIRLSGAPDMILEIGGELVLNDLKTSGKRISGSIEMDEKLAEHKETLKSLNSELIALNKKIEKFSNAENKVKEIGAELEEVEAKIADAEANGKATKALENKVAKLEEELVKWSDHNAELQSNILHAATISSSMQELDELIEPLQAAYDEEKAEADLIACKKAHGQQLAFYSILYMIRYGKEIKRVRIENMVKLSAPELQVFEWELDDYELAKAEEEIQNNISLIELAINGVDPMVLFRLNTTSYIGDDVIKFVDEVEALVRNHKEEASYEPVAA